MPQPTITRWNVRQSTGAQSQASLTTHQFRRGRGYYQFASNAELLRHAPHMALRNGPKRDGQCVPPDETKDRSVHLLRPPGGHPLLMCAWIDQERAWLPLTRDGKRMAFTADYLASHGWIYGRAHESATKQIARS